MRAVMFHGKEDLRVEEVAEPSPGPGQVKIRNAFSGICGTDVHLYYDPGAIGLDLTTPHPLTGACLPVPFGHEFSGIVVEVGSGVANLRPDDKVAINPVIRCGICRACRRGMTSCINIAGLGFAADTGGLQEYSVIDAKSAHFLPEGVTLEMGALVEPMAVAWHAVKKARPVPGETALILGAGPIGIGSFFALRAHGIRDVIVSDPSPTRRENIVRLGCGQAIDPLTTDLSQAVTKFSNQRGADIVVDAAGVAPALTTAVDSLAEAGRAIVAALHSGPASINPTPVMLGEKEVIGSLGYTSADIDEVIKAMSEGLYSLDGWVVRRPLEQIESAIEDLHRGTHMKVLLPVGEQSS